MKKCFFQKLLFCLLSLTSVFTYISCDNFLNGTFLADEIKQQIELAKTPDVTVTVSCNNSYGTITSGSAVTKKLGTSNIKLSFTEADAYQFVKWQVYDKDGNAQGCTEEDAIFIKDPSNSSTSFSVIKEVNGYSIGVTCALRPEITIASPQYQTSGVNRDRAIIINFNSNVEKSAFRYTDEEIKKLESKGYELLKDSNNEVYGYSNQSAIFYKNIKIRNSNNTSENLLGFFGVPEISGSKVTIAPTKAAGKQYQLDSNGYKDIEVIIDESVSVSSIKMRKSYSWTFRANNTTDAQTTVAVSIEADKGTVTPTGTSTYSVGIEVPLTFKEKEAYKFIKWNVEEGTLDSPSGAVTSSIFNNETNTYNGILTIMEGEGNLSVKPFCVERPVVTSVSPVFVSAGTSFDSDIVINLGAAVAKENFTYSSIEITSFGEKAAFVYADSNDSESDVIAIDVAGKRYFKNITILDERGENIASHYNKLSLSEDKKTLKLSFDPSNLFDFKNSNTKSVYVTLNSNIYSEYKDESGIVQKIKMNDKDLNYDFNFNVNQTSSAKAVVKFSALDGETSMGTITYTNTQVFSLGESFTVNFTPSENYEFIKWSVTGNDNNQLKVEESGTKITCTVMGAADNIEIKPVCDKLNISQILFSATSGTVSPSGYVDYHRKAEIPLVSTISSDYKFTKWKVYNTITKKYYDDETTATFFKFEDPYSPTTSVTVLQDSANLCIEATALPRPQVYAKTPEGIITETNRDTNIRIFTDHSLVEETLYYTNDEARRLKADGYEILSENYDSASDTYTKPYGYYKSGNNESYVFKGVKVTDNSDGKNYLRFFGCPYISGFNYNIIIIPVKKVKKDGVLSETENLPGKKEILVQLNSEYGYSDSNVTVGLNNVNLSWLYKTNNSFDTTAPTFTSATIKGNGSSDNKTYTKNASNTIPALGPSMSATDRSWYSNAYLKTTEENGTKVSNLTLSVNVGDASSNLQTLNLMIEKKRDANYNDASRNYFINLPLTISGTSGNYDGTVDLRKAADGGLPDGLYKLYFKVIDEAGNYVQTDFTHYYYILLDTTAPKASDTPLKFFYRNKKVIVQNLKTNFKDTNNDLNYYSSTVTVGGTSQNITCLDSDISTLSSGINNNVDYNLVIHLVDLTGHTTEYTYTVNAGIKPGMYVYSNGYCSSHKYSDMNIYGVVIDDKDNNYSTVKFVTVKTYSKNPADIDSLSETFNVNGSNIILGLPSIEEMDMVKQQEAVLDDITYNYDKNNRYKLQSPNLFVNGQMVDHITARDYENYYTAGSQGDYLRIYYKYRLLELNYTSEYFEKGFLYYTNVKNVNNSSASKYTDLYYDSNFTNHVLYNTYASGSAQYEQGNIYDKYTEMCYFTDAWYFKQYGNSNSGKVLYNAKLIGKFTDN